MRRADEARTVVLADASSHPSWWQIDAVLVGEADAAATREVREHLERCERCAAQVTEAQEIDRAFRTDVAPRIRAGVEARAGADIRPIRSARGPRTWLAAAAAVLVAVGAAVWLSQAPTASPDGPALDGTHRTKGTPFIEVFVKRGDGVSRFASSDGVLRLRAGDRLRFVPRDVGNRSFLLLNLTAAGELQFLFPEDGRPTRVADGEPLPGAFIVDEAPGPERLFALFPLESMSATDVRGLLGRLPTGADALRRLERLPTEVLQETFFVEKGAN